MTAGGRTALYRLYDSTEALLYVGVTGDPRRRFRQHERDKPWWPQVATRDIEWFPDKRSALDTERDTVRNDAPRYNQRGTIWFPPELGDCTAEMETISGLKVNTAELLDRVASTGKPIVITVQGRAVAALAPLQLAMTGTTATSDTDHTQGASR